MERAAILPKIYDKFIPKKLFEQVLEYTEKVIKEPITHSNEILDAMDTKVININLDPESERFILKHGGINKFIRLAMLWSLSHVNFSAEDMRRNLELYLTNDSSHVMLVLVSSSSAKMIEDTMQHIWCPDMHGRRESLRSGAFVYACIRCYKAALMCGKTVYEFPNSYYRTYMSTSALHTLIDCYEAAHGKSVKTRPTLLPIGRMILFKFVEQYYHRMQHIRQDSMRRSAIEPTKPAASVKPIEIVDSHRTLVDCDHRDGNGKYTITMRSDGTCVCTKCGAKFALVKSDDGLPIINPNEKNFDLDLELDKYEGFAKKLVDTLLSGTLKQSYIDELNEKLSYIK